MGFNFLDLLVDTFEIGVTENKRDHLPMSLRWTMADRVGHEMRESKIDPYAYIQYTLAERGVP